jgi:transposase
MQLYAGLDVHQAFTVGSIVDEKGNPLLEQQVPTNEAGYHILFGRLKAKNRIKAVFEASRNWPYIADLLKEQGVESVMAHPMRVRAIASARIKTDKIDSRILAHLLRADLIPTSYMPVAAIVELRRLVRYRVTVGRMRAQLKTRIRAVLAQEGKTCDWTDPTGKAARLWLRHAQLTERNRHQVDYFLGLINNLDEELGVLDEQMHAEAVRRPEVALLTSIPGIAEYSALLILAEIGDFTRFETADKLAAYAGLVSSTYQSGQNCYQGHITKQGNRWLRWILVECATIAVRKTNRLQRFFRRLQMKKGYQKAIVATARKELTIMWTLLQRQEVFQT